MSITIIKPGISSSLQHFGHWGEQEFGVSIGGVMDDFSASIANIICSNEATAPVIEMTLHGSEDRPTGSKYYERDRNVICQK